MKSTMFSRISRTLGELRTNASGNTALILAAGMPALIGGAGLAVDTAQWFMWKREMQNAVDQAAIAGAWSRVNGTTGNEYITRAQQELASNLQMVTFNNSPTIALQGYAGGTDNSVLVSMNGTKSLPFTSFLTSRGVTVAVSARAVFEKGRTFTSCLIAVDPDTKGAITISGSAYVIANCGAAALSDDAEAVTSNGGAVFQVGWIVAAGGIDDDFNNGETQVYENQQGLVDPFQNLTPPTGNGQSKTLTCEPPTTKYIATYTDTTSTYTRTYEGPDESNMTLVSSSTPATGSETKTKEVDNKTKVGDTFVISAAATTHTGTPTPFTKTTTTGNGKNATTTTATWYRRIDDVGEQNGKITAINAVTTPGGAHATPGTYTDFTISCNTVMDKGVYVINGGQFASNAQYTLDGDGVMIVLKGGAGIKINGGSRTYLRAMSFSEMTDARYGNMTEEQAMQLKDMLIFEDRNSSGDDTNKVNGNSGITLDGTIYLPKSKLTFNGTAGVVSRCLIIASKQIEIGGDAHMTSFCPSDVTNTVSVGGGEASVRLVS